LSIITFSLIIRSASARVRTGCSRIMSLNAK
jgi:hypothetical protein